MKFFRSACSILVAGSAAASAAWSGVSENRAPAQILTTDVDRFYRIYTTAGGHPDAHILQREYLEAGSEGLRAFARIRNVTGVRLAASVEKSPALYENAQQCALKLPGSRRRMERVLSKLREIYPQAKQPPITVVIGPGKPVGVGSPVTGLQIGLEALCGITYIDKDLGDRFVHVAAHEYVHVQQTRELVDDTAPTVLEASLIEGAAEFIAELISGGVADPNLALTMRGREKQIETQFLADKHSRDLSAWLYNGTMTVPGDIGYRVGYRIVKAYYRQAHNKRRTVREIIEMRDSKAFLDRSGWYPGIRL